MIRVVHGLQKETVRVILSGWLSNVLSVADYAEILISNQVITFCGFSIEVSIVYKSELLSISLVS